ncbi:alpha-L-fucosidase [Catalinimonas alkaloidigena]|uniref:alpha-L-fucosidase n=1 Tax=Catalinimonas alkaloidigena TaxID=1075417 RepID=A0A1G8YH72_9BACT|nr:alpha-L-fucosidase [Catalinimonas alkaloidigena]SDK01420.1 alpha-L-fucosidase [Catalinimonas alkaloidigena]
MILRSSAPAWALACTLLAAACSSPQSTEQTGPVAPPAPLLPVPSEAQQNWHEMELNAFIHFTTNTFTDKEWGYGDEDPSIFNPTDIDVTQWITTLKDAGFKGVILTCKHHDGFALWPSQYTEHDIASSPFQGGNGDLVKAVSEACRAQGLKFGVYLSPWDRNRADYGQPSYVEYYRNQLREIFNNYGPVFEMWFDGANGGDGYYGGAREKRNIDRQTYYDWPTTIQLVRDLQPEPQVLFFSDAGPDIRWVGNERGVAGETNWNTISNDTLYAGKAGVEDLLATGSPDGTKWIPAEVDVSIRPGWFYHASEDGKVKTPQQLFDIYLSSVGRGSNLLLNVPPDRRGRIHENDVAALKGWRKLLDSTFATNLAEGAEITADAYRGQADAYAAGQVLDDDPETYWATDDSVTTGALTITLPNAAPLHYLELQEYIPLGQRVASFAVEAWQEGAWQPVAEASTIGYKRILPLGGITTDKLRVTIREAQACPTVSHLAIY